MLKTQKEIFLKNSFTLEASLCVWFMMQQSKPVTFSVYSHTPLMTGEEFWLLPQKRKSRSHLRNIEVVTVRQKLLINLPGGVQASAGDWTNVDRLLVGMGKAIFCSLCFASAA